jgi:hypothetical protein
VPEYGDRIIDRCVGTRAGGSAPDLE